ncbi:twin-arginine translocase TatA/TatE family subunit [candidate division WWE3 bacterium]|jgi:sec-independent protein translocase protein TatA|uniref:Twin-arginine translocase TatA/TatE family subunit n=1 Tax=candidate division WWE3 bacterium TaxID=2053526 RepID=A0A3A4ZCK3_UNCKA|nr:MAG: twin-arginine translocase TatA/TatE family subunit [candidate division WWE3 bacterium]
MFRSLGTTEWIVITVIVVVLLGSKKLPEFFKGVSDAVKEFKKAAKDEGEQEKKV